MQHAELSQSFTEAFDYLDDHTKVSIYLCFDPDQRSFRFFDFQVPDDIADYNALSKLRLIGFLDRDGVKKLNALDSLDDTFARIMDVLKTGVVDPVHFNLANLAY